MNSPKSWLVFAGAVVAYVVAVTQRSTFGVAAIDATERFDATAAAVSTAAVLQLVVYAGLQIPVGLLIDRVGPRPLLVIGAGIMTLGQALLAVAPDLAVAAAARMLVGAGDAFTFISVVRLLPLWFSGRLVPQLVQLTGMLGQLGQVLAAVPFALLLHGAGWRSAFLLAASLSLFALAVLVATVRRREPTGATAPVPVERTMSRLRAALARPGTWLGFWVHALAGGPPTLFAILWGYPFLTEGLGFDVGLAATVMSLPVAANVVAAPTVGWLVARFPFRRSNVVLAIAAAVFGVWLLVLAWPGVPPFALIVVFFLVVGAGGPGSLVGFDLARSFNPGHHLGSASGVVNVGGFLAGFVGMLLVGVLLDVGRALGLGGYSLDAFRFAFLAPIAIGVLCTAMLLHTRRHVRRRMFEEEGITVAPLWVALFGRRRRRGGSAGS